MKQLLRKDVVLNLLMLLVLGKFDNLARATEIPSNLPATTVREWRSRQSRGAARSQINNYPATISQIEVRSTRDGIEIILTTASGEQLQGITSTVGNNLIIDLPNARLDLPEEDKLRENPADGIASVTVTTSGVNNVRVIVAGVTETPIGEIITTPQGITLSVIPVLAETETPDQVIDIVVTAQKQPENLQDVPISITTFSQEEIEDARIDSFRDVAANTPNFFTTLGDRTFNFQTIRGLGNAGFLTRDSISFFIDDVPYENVHQLLPGALFDLERVEVLRGPQSTLYGRNSQGG